MREVTRLRELEAAIAAARKAGEILRAGFGREHQRLVKGVIDFATEIDLASEKAIVSLLQAATPEYGFLTEEGTVAPGREEVRWIVDPLDGTVNYAHGSPHFSVSIALERAGEIEVGAIYDPMRDEMFTAQRGGGARLNGEQIGVRTADDLAHALLLTNWGYDVWTAQDDNFPEITYMVKHSLGVRSTGSAALDLAAAACGRSDGYWERGIKPHDFAAGALLVREAGGVVTDYAGKPEVLGGDSIVAAGPSIHTQMLAAIQEVRQAAVLHKK